MHRLLCGIGGSLTQFSEVAKSPDTKLSAFTIVCSKLHFEENVAFTDFCVLAFLKQSFLSLLSAVVTTQDTILKTEYSTISD